MTSGIIIESDWIEWEEKWCPGMHGPKECEVIKYIRMTVNDAIKAQRTIAAYNGYSPDIYQALDEFMRNKKAYFIY